MFQWYGSRVSRKPCDPYVRITAERSILYPFLEPYPYAFDQHEFPRPGIKLYRLYKPHSPPPKKNSNTIQTNTQTKSRTQEFESTPPGPTPACSFPADRGFALRPWNEAIGQSNKKNCNKKMPRNPQNVSLLHVEAGLMNRSELTRFFHEVINSSRSCGALGFVFHCFPGVQWSAEPPYNRPCLIKPQAKTPWKVHPSRGRPGSLAGEF